MRGIYAPTFLLALAHVRRLTPPRLAVPTPPPPADDYTTTAWEAAAPPTLPANALVLEEADEAVWADETLEFNGLRADPRTPPPLQAYLTSFRLYGQRYCHAFSGDGETLAQFVPRCAGAGRLSDVSRLRLVMQLLDAVQFLHSRGSAHLGLDAQVVRIVQPPLASTAPDELQLRVIGLGAAVRLGAASGRTAYQMANDVSFHAPELLSSAILNSNLRALFKLDSWAVGVLLTMLCGALGASPFQREADWTKGELTVQQATRNQIMAVQQDYGGFLLRLDASSGGFVFRHGWIVRLLLGLLASDPTQRLTVNQAWEIATEATAGTVAFPSLPAEVRAAAAAVEAAAAALEAAAATAAAAAAAEGGRRRGRE